LSGAPLTRLGAQGNEIPASSSSAWSARSKLTHEPQIDAESDDSGVDRERSGDSERRPTVGATANEEFSTDVACVRVVVDDKDTGRMRDLQRDGAVSSRHLDSQSMTNTMAPKQIGLWGAGRLPVRNF
jgi:hypothetical protein